MAVGPDLFVGWAKAGDVYDCADFGCSCGWYYEYEVGEPMGGRHPSPLVQILATSQDQVDNIWRPLTAMIRFNDSPLRPLLLPREEFIRVAGENPDDPDLDRIDAVTSAATSRLGNPVTGYVQDETGIYTTRNGMVATAETMRRGAAGMQGRGITTTNPWDPSEDSTAQRAYEADMPDVFTFYSPPPPGLLFLDRRQRRKILEHNYAGITHTNVDAILAECDELMLKNPQGAERFFGNRVVQMNRRHLEQRSRQLSAPRLGSRMAERSALRLRYVPPRQSSVLPPAALLRPVGLDAGLSALRPGVQPRAAAVEPGLLDRRPLGLSPAGGVRPLSLGALL